MTNIGNNISKWTANLEKLVSEPFSSTLIKQGKLEKTIKKVESLTLAKFTNIGSIY